MAAGREELSDNLMMCTEMRYVRITGGGDGTQRDEGGMPEALCNEGPIRCAHTGATGKHNQVGVNRTDPGVSASQWQVRRLTRLGAWPGPGSPDTRCGTSLPTRRSTRACGFGL